MRSRLSVLALPLTLALACGENAAPTGATHSGGSSGAGAGATSGGTTSMGGSAGGSGGSVGGSAGASGGTAGLGGAVSAGQGGVGAGGTGANGGAAGTAASSGRGGVAGTDSAAGTGGSGNGGAGASAGGSSGSGGTAGSAGSAMGGSGNAGGCTRELLTATIDAYFEALAAHDPSTLPLAANARFTENGEAMDLGDGGLWETAGAVVHTHSALDTEICSSATQAVVPDGNTNIPVALRLKLVNQELTEIEMIAVRQGDYSVASNTQALIASATSVGWETPVATGERGTRDELTAWVNKYYRLFPAGVCNTTDDCIRIENGGGNYGCDTGGSCANREPGPNDDALVPRLLFADVERGLAIGFTMFMGNTDMHMFKLRGGDVYGVSAILGSAGGPGWP